MNPSTLQSPTTPLEAETAGAPVLRANGFSVPLASCQHDTDSPLLRRELAGTIARRLGDWRYGHVIYQIFVDRFTPSTRLESKRHLYESPRKLMEWNALPIKGRYILEERINEQEIEFWGGDLDGVLRRLDYIQELGADVVYLNPIFHAFTNHKYDALDYHEVDPQYGTREELKTLAGELHQRGMRLILDGVFNHMGCRSPYFERAAGDNQSAERPWFDFHENFRWGYRSWRNAANLPELNLEHAEVRDMIFDNENSVVRRYLREVGIDGWRLDVAPDLGFHWLDQLRQSALSVNPESVIIGECWNYPEEWLSVLDGVMNMHARLIILALVQGRIGPQHAGRMLERMVQDAGIDGLLKSHLVIDNHDIARSATLLADDAARRLAFILQFTLPGCPVIYYGSELGMTGGQDPENRAPMRWDLVCDDNPTLALHRLLLKIRHENPALRVGDFRLLDTERTLAFMRLTARARETVLVIINPSPTESVTELIPLRDSRLMDAAPLVCLLDEHQTSASCGLLEVTLAPQTARIYRTLDRGEKIEYSAFKRVP